jgi:ribosomal protein L28
MEVRVCDGELVKAVRLILALCVSVRRPSLRDTKVGSRRMRCDRAGPMAVANGVAGARRSIRRRFLPNVILTRESHPAYIATKVAAHAMTLLWTRTHPYLKQTDVRLLFGRRLP